MAEPGFRSSLKPLEVEEPVDVLLHRPLGYLIARAAYATPVTADQLTLLSMVIGFGAGASTLVSITHPSPWRVLGGVLLVLAATVDCSDGQLARMRQTSSPFGRMLDGAVDAVVQFAMFPGVMAHLWCHHGGAWPGPGMAAWGSLREPVLWIVYALLACVSLGVHTLLCDHFKNVYLHHTQPSRKEGDDLDELERRYAPGAAALGFFGRLRFQLYRGHVRAQRDLMRWIDPHVPARFRDMPGYSPEGAERYRALHKGLMRAWSFFGIGTHSTMAGLALALDLFDLNVIARLVAFNVVLVVLVPLQRRASRAFFGPVAGAPRGGRPSATTRVAGAG